MLRVKAIGLSILLSRSSPWDAWAVPTFRFPSDTLPGYPPFFADPELVSLAAALKVLGPQSRRLPVSLPVLEHKLQPDLELIWLKPKNHEKCNIARSYENATWLFWLGVPCFPRLTLRWWSDRIDWVQRSARSLGCAGPKFNLQIFRMNADWQPRDLLMSTFEGIFVATFAKLMRIWAICLSRTVGFFSAPSGKSKRPEG